MTSGHASLEVKADDPAISGGRPVPISTANTTPRPPSDTNIANKSSLNAKKSLRNLKPTNASTTHHGVPVPAMKEQVAPQLRKSSSLFNLFSKPKVEKARGHGGESSAKVEVQPIPHTKQPALPLKSALKTSQSNPLIPAKVNDNNLSRTTSALSFNRPLSRQIPPSRGEVTMIQEVKPGTWIPPPLFQAFARSVKHGLAEVSSGSSVEKTASRPKAAFKDIRSTTNGRNSPESNESVNTRHTKLTVKGSKSNANTQVEVSQQILILLDSGQVLQYSQHGPTNRLPERVLHLGPESEASANEAVPGRQCSIRIHQNTGSKSFSFSSAFSRLARRNIVTKRETPSLLIVLQDPQDMSEWLDALQTQITRFGRKMSVTSRETPSVWRSPVIEEEEKSTRLEEPKSQKPLPVEPAHTTAPPFEASSTHKEPVQSEKQSETFFDDSDDMTERNSLELLEEEANKLTARPLLTEDDNDRRTSDAPSFASTTAPSVDQQALNNLRNSARMSHISSATGFTSRTNSITSEPSSTKPSHESSAENGVNKSPYRSLSSYNTTKRRSMLPPTSQLSTSPPTTTSAIADLQSSSSSNTISPPRPMAPRSPPAIASALESLELSANDSTPPIAEEDERPESIVADLPPPSTWSTKPSPKKRISLAAPVPDKQLRRLSSPSLQTAPSQTPPSRRASQAFRIPLKVNLDNSANRTPKANPRASMIVSPASDTPKVFTLEAKVDPSRRASVSHSATGLKKQPSQRLSLFPSPLLPPNSFPEETRRPSLPTPSSTQINPELVNVRRASLQRPTSLQVRTDRAPFVSSVRSSVSPAPANDSSTKSPPIDQPATTPPIRSLKPSRSTSAIPSLAKQVEKEEETRPASPTDPFQSMNPPRMEEDEGIHIPTRRQSHMIKQPPLMINLPTTAPLSLPPSAPLPSAPVGSMGNSFARQMSTNRHSLKPRMSAMGPMLTVDLGMPVVGLGPPAPPPNAPLPAPPGGAPAGITGPVTPISSGVLASSTETSVSQKALSPPVEGLGIRVG